MYTGLSLTKRPDDSQGRYEGSMWDLIWCSRVRVGVVVLGSVGRLITTRISITLCSWTVVRLSGNMLSFGSWDPSSQVFPPKSLNDKNIHLHRRLLLNKGVKLSTLKICLKVGTANAPQDQRQN